MFNFESESKQGSLFSYETLLAFAKGLMENERDRIANLANISALIFEQFENINWAGFYLLKKGQLVLGPFQGKPACIRIELGKGVCGTAASTSTTQCVEDVHTFPGHIACDAASNSEIVVPIKVKDHVVAVLDIDSPLKGRFDKADIKGLEELAELISHSCEWEE